jgi:hypothetical protein
VNCCVAWIKKNDWKHIAKHQHSTWIVFGTECSTVEVPEAGVQICFALVFEAAVVTSCFSEAEQQNGKRETDSPLKRVLWCPQLSDLQIPGKGTHG